MSLVSKFWSLGLVACIGLCATSSEAATIPPGGSLLSDLIAGTATVTSGDKMITDASYIAVGPDMPDPSQIVVAPLMDIHGNFGFRFVGPFFDLDDGKASDALLEFTVSIIDPTQEIIGLVLMGNPSVSGSQGIASITETALPHEINTSLEIAAQKPGGFVGMDSAILSAGHTTLRIQKDILLSAGVGSTAKLSFFDQTFVQRIVAQPIPEPTSLGLLSCACVGLLSWRRRRV